MVEVSFPPLQRGNALRDAPRHRSSPRRIPEIGRGASRTACRRGASHDSRLTAPTRSGTAPASARSSV
ncbi:DUF1534 domain-containing protein [Pseudomonas cannabina]|nr:DUF1534 domain-containing protein [Pseudomonas cannabina]